MGDRILRPGHDPSGYYSKLKKPLSNPRQHKCPYNVRECKVCYPKLETKIGELVEEKFVLKAPEWVKSDIKLCMVLANFYPEASTNPKQQKRAIRDFELIDVCWRQHRAAAESPMLEMTPVAIRKRLSRIREDAAQYVKNNDAADWRAVEIPPIEDTRARTEEEADAFFAYFLFEDGNRPDLNTVMNDYVKKWCMPHFFHLTSSK